MGTVNHEKGTSKAKFLEKTDKTTTTKIITRRRAFALLALKNINKKVVKLHNILWHHVICPRQDLASRHTYTYKVHYSVL